MSRYVGNNESDKYAMAKCICGGSPVSDVNVSDNKRNDINEN